MKDGTNAAAVREKEAEDAEAQGRKMNRGYSGEYDQKFGGG